MKVIAVLWVLVTVACGGQATTSSGAAGGASAATPGVGPIDPTGLPSEIPNQCQGRLSALHLALPCAVGTSLTGAPTSSGGGISVVECYDSSGQTALSFTVPVGELPQLLGQPVPIPFQGLPMQPNVGLVLEGTAYVGLLTGTAVFSRVDPEARSFVAQLSGATIKWTRADQVELTCPVPPIDLWAVAGNFR